MVKLDNRFQSLENKLHKGIGQHLAKCLEAANVTVLEDSCKKLQKSVEDLLSKIDSLSISNNNLHIEIENTSQSLSEPAQSKSVAATLPNTTMGIIDELADHDRRKKNLIVYNLPESAPNNQSDSDAFAA